MLSANLDRIIGAQGWIEVRIFAGIRLNYPPHLGTYFFLACCFALAENIRTGYKTQASVSIQGLDNAPVVVIGDLLSGLRKPLYLHQRRDASLQYFDRNYGRFLSDLTHIYSVPYHFTLYTDFQSLPVVRREFLRSLHLRETLKWCISPFHSLLHESDLIGVRFSCRDCGFSTFYGEACKIVELSLQEATFASTCEIHGGFHSAISEKNGTIIDLQKVYRNILKEAVLAENNGVLNIIAKGSDWLEACSNVDRGLAVLGKNPGPPRIFFPVLETESGIKLSKSGIQMEPELFREVPESIRNATLYLEKTKHASYGLAQSANRLISEPEPALRPLKISAFF